MYTEKYRTGLKRLWAAIVDGIVFMPLLLLEQWIYKTTDNVSALFVWATFVSFAPLIYSVVLHYKSGQTIGKWVAGVKVLDISETRKITLRQSIYRDGFYLIVALVGLIYYSFLLARSDDNQSILANYSSFSDNPVFWWTLIELITMLTNSKRRALHDFIAKSIVIRTGISS
jgi:uncharacterized RDD family membrane protein YckC